MPKKPHPDRANFDSQLEALERIGIFPEYATIIRHTRPDLDKSLIQDVRYGRRVNIDVLGEIRRVVMERLEAKLKHPVALQVA